MYVSKENVLALLPEYKDKWNVVSDNQDVDDIINDLVQAHEDYEPLYDKIGFLFIGNTTAETCDNLYKFCKANIKYKEESVDHQTLSVPQGILTRGFGDCKHYASFIGGCLGAIERYTGKKIDWQYCFASYKFFEPSPYHVFVSVNEGSKQIYVDPTPGADGRQPVWLDEIKIKKSNMLKRNIAGFDNSAAVFPMMTVTPIIPQISAIGATSPNVLGIGNFTNQQLLIGGAGIAAVIYFANKKSLSGMNKKNIIPLILVGGVAAYFLWKKFGNNDPEVGDFVPVDGVLNIAPGVHAAYAARIAAAGGFASDLGNGIYAAVLKAGLPAYASDINKMTLDEQMALYHLANDYPASNISSADSAYNTLVGIKSKYGFKFF